MRVERECETELDRYIQIETVIEVKVEIEMNIEVELSLCKYVCLQIQMDR